METGIYPISQYTFIFIMLMNPIFFKMFKPYQFIFFFIGVAASFINSRAIMPFLMLICLDLDLSKLNDREKKTMMLFLFFQLFMLFTFGS